MHEILTPKASNFIKKGPLAQLFFCEFSKISKNTFFYRTPPVADSACTYVGLLNFKKQLNKSLSQTFLDSNFMQTKLHHWCFPMNSAMFLQTLFL